MRGPEKGRRFIALVAAMLWALCASGTASAAEYYDEQLNAGLWNNEPYSYSLIKNASKDPAGARRSLEEALRHSPDFPPVYFKLSAESFSLSPGNAYRSLDYAYRGIKSYGRSFWWSASFRGLLYFSLYITFWLTAAAVVAIRLPVEIDRIKHDLRESSRTLVLLLIMLALSAFGPLGFLAGALMVLGIYMGRFDKAVLYITLLVIAISPPALKAMNRYSYVSGPELRAMVAVNEARGNRDAVASLSGAEDFASRLSYATALKRSGFYKEAMQTLEDLRAGSDDPRVLVNLANVRVALGGLDAALDLYNRAIEARPSVKAVYNLSQVYREKFDYPNGDKYYRMAQEMDNESVKVFSNIASRHPNRLVIDETLTSAELWEFAERYQRPAFNPFTVPPFAMAVAALVAVMVFLYMDLKTKHRAYRCTKCEVTLCGRCARVSVWGSMCEECYESAVKPGRQDAKERVAKLLSIYDLQSKRREMLRYLSFAPPGIAQFYAGKNLMGFIFFTAFVFPAVFMLLDPMFTTGLFGFDHGWTTLPFMFFMLILYFVSNVIVRRKVENGWL